MFISIFFQNFSWVLFNEPKGSRNENEDSVIQGLDEDADVTTDRGTKSKTSNMDEKRKALVKKSPVFLTYLQSTPEN